MLKLKKLTSLNLIWVNHQGFWAYPCQSCGQVRFEKKERRKTC